MGPLKFISMVLKGAASEARGVEAKKGVAGSEGVRRVGFRMGMSAGGSSASSFVGGEGCF